jgi:hypothetical protein
MLQALTSDSVDRMDGVVETTAALVRRFEERLGARIVGAGIGGSILSEGSDAYADVDLLIATRGLRERWRIPEAGTVFDVFVIDIDKVDLTGRSIDYDHVVRLLAGLRVLSDTDGVLASLAQEASQRLVGLRAAVDVPSYSLYSMVFDAQRKLRRALSHANALDCRIRSVLLVGNAAKLLIVEHRAWLDGDYIPTLERLDPAAARLATGAITEPDPFAAARRALIFGAYVLRRRAGVETTTLSRRFGKST